MVTTELLCYSDVAREKGIENKPSTIFQFMNLVQLSRVLRSIESLLGIDLIINSGFRCPALNSAVGGSVGSYHLLGLAADIRVENTARCTMADLRELCKILRKTRLVEVIDHETYIHVAIKQYNY